MNFDLEQRFDAPIEDVAALFLAPEYVQRIAGLPGLDGAELLHQSADGGTVRRQIRFAFGGSLSPTAAAFIDTGRLTWVETSVTDRYSHQGEFSVLADHYPEMLRCRGTVALEDLGGVTRRLTHVELDVSVPLVGATVAGAIVSGLRNFSIAEASMVQRWLDERAFVASDITEGTFGPADTHERHADRSGSVSGMNGVGGSEGSGDASTSRSPDSAESADLGGLPSSLTEQLLAAFGAQWRAVIDSVVGQVTDQVRGAMTDLSDQWRQSSEQFVGQLGSQWGQMQQTVASGLQEALNLPVTQVSASGGDSAAAGPSTETAPSIEVLLRPLVAHLNVALEQMTEQLNAQLNRAPLVSRRQDPTEKES